MLEILTMTTKCSDPALGVTIHAIRNIVNIIGIIVPITLIVMTIYNFIQLVRNPDDKKGIKKIINSFIAAVVVFMIPTIVSSVMLMLDERLTVSSCWNSTVEYARHNSYIPLSNQNTTKIINDPSEFERGVARPSDDTYSGATIEGTAQTIGDVVWDPNDVTRKSNLTSSQLIAALNAVGGNYTNFVPYASGLVTTENKYDVNLLFLIGLEAWESGWVQSSISRNCNNLGGVCASSAHPSNGCGSNDNCSFAYFNSVNEFIDYHGKYLHENYLTPGGTYYEGTDIMSVYTKHYCTGPECVVGPQNMQNIVKPILNALPSILGGD